MTGYLASIVLALVALAIQYSRLGTHLSPDGVVYTSLAAGGRVPAPFAWRRFLPEIIGPRPWVWRVVSWGSWVLCAPALFALSHSITAVYLWAFLPVGAQLIRHPVLVDAPALLLMMLAVLAFRADEPILAVGIAVLATSCKEPAGILAGAIAGSWLIVVASTIAALLTIGVGLSYDPSDVEHAHPVPVRHDWLDARRMLLPWGAGALALLSEWSPAALMATGLAYAQMLLANDEPRLYQWAAPAVLPIAASTLDSLPPLLSLAAIVAHPFLCAAVRESR